MSNLILREPSLEDKHPFIEGIKQSTLLHAQWVSAPKTSDEYDIYLRKISGSTEKNFLLWHEVNQLVGVFNISNIVRGMFQSAYLGFYAIEPHSGKGLMSQGLKLILKTVFAEMQLHRLEANIQPTNFASLQLVKNNLFRYEGFSPRYLKINNVWQGHERWAVTVEDTLQQDKGHAVGDSIQLVSYNPLWPDMARKEISKLVASFPAGIIVDLQHVGSTAVPKLLAKPIIDIQVAVSSLAAIKLLAIVSLQKLDYVYIEDPRDDTRLFFVKGMPPYGSHRTHHVHIVEQTSSHWHEELLFRDYLIMHPKVADEYAALKLYLAKLYSQNREAYTQNKSTFITKIIKMANNA
jgi:GrpB-like predicted nucleotidyltransferase (UPF0157 family)/RimJ/RimL family protein N-acetyltransferase